MQAVAAYAQELQASAVEKARADNEDRVVKKVKAAKERAIKETEDKSHRAVSAQKQKVGHILSEQGSCEAHTMQI